MKRRRWRWKTAAHLPPRLIGAELELAELVDALAETYQDESDEEGHPEVSRVLRVAAATSRGIAAAIRRRAVR